MDQLRVLVAEDQLLLRQGLVTLLAANDIDVVGEVDNGDAIVPAVLELQPDLALLDIRLPPTHRDEGLRAAHAVRLQRPGQPVLMLSQYVEQLYVDELLADRRGAVGYLLKDRVFDAEQFCADLRTVAGGGTVIDPEVVSELMRRRRHADQLARLTPRELQTLELMAQGASNATIATQFVVTEKAVAKNINSLLAKLDLPPDEGPASRRVLAVLAYLRR